MREILFVVGEASGDLHAGKVAEALHAMSPDLKLVGIGGGHMRAAGVEIIEDVENLAVMGFAEVIRHIPKHYALLGRLRERIESGSVALVVLLDYPGFNLKVADVAKKAGVPVLYYITPQVWAWGAGRLPKLARVVSKAASILPFEEALLRRHGVDATFVGHPLLDRAQSLPTQSAARAALGLPTDGPILAVFPGSRRAELARHLKPFMDTATLLQSRIPGLHVVVSVAPTVQISAADCPFPRVHGASFNVLRAATAGLLKSGTTTLEAAVAGLPHVIGYRTSAITYAIARRVVKIPHIGLVNVVAHREVSREFVQDAFEPSRVADALMPLLDVHSAIRAEAEAGLSEVRGMLGTPGASERVANMIRELVDARPA
ncbi:lipid-A-disaccharide synthase [Gemmatimonas groenlandica]|uniref:Lipid-A-disaccharide synthase n=1 Tax=Gemmatimonas groenlandica TaxID=2732249 RepID=A0A6M4IMV5_9BACT|nr:lipid-A-disaccharide synthase [Gemmatimonas groenlandica]QJR35109.1 lipid-A-disaccharide synthase [Gemmatimonas groenlandica]